MNGKEPLEEAVLEEAAQSWAESMVSLPEPSRSPHLRSLQGDADRGSEFAQRALFLYNQIVVTE